MLIVKGTGNVGKSTAVKTAFERVLNSILKKLVPTSVKYLYLTNREVAAAIQVGTSTVYISTRGGNKKEVKRALSFFSQEKCKVVICATRSNGDPYKAAREFAHLNLNIEEPVEFPKTSENDESKRTLTDLAFAKKIHSWATKAIKTT